MIVMELQNENYQPAACRFQPAAPSWFEFPTKAQRSRLKAASRQLVVFLCLFLLSARYSEAQARLTTADYARAERFLMDSVLPYVTGIGVQPVWLSGNRVAYRNPKRGAGGIILVDPARGSRVACNPDTDRCGGALDPREVL